VPLLGIDGAKNPGVAMIAHYHPAISFRITLDTRHYIPQRACLIVHVGAQMYLHIVAAANVISECQAALKSARPDGSFQGTNQLLRFVIAERLQPGWKEYPRMLPLA